MSDEEGLTKVFVDLPNHWATKGESIWARPLGGDLYELRNVPFHAYDLNSRDVVEAVAEAPDQKPSVRRVVERSGHRTLRVIFAKTVTEDTAFELLNSLEPLHVTFERATQRYFALDLLPEADMAAVRTELDRWEDSGWAEYETCAARVEGSFDDEPEEESEEA